MEKFIPNTNKKYAVDSSGNVWCLYRRNKNGVFLKTKKLLAKCFTNLKNKKCINVAVTLFLNNGERKRINVNSLMIHTFKLKQPDQLRRYKPYNIDGNVFNNSIENIGFKPELISEFSFYPTCTYNEFGEVVSKTCVSCGKDIDIKEYTVAYKHNDKQTLRNKCNSCRSKQNIERIYNDIILYEKSRKWQKKWTQSNDGKKYRTQYLKVYKQENKKIISVRYLAGILHTTVANIENDYELIDMMRKKIMLERFINNKN